jgi:hypothetical protein
MSAWSVGRASGTSSLDGQETGVKPFVDRVIQWIPADVIAIYTVGITQLKTETPDPNPSELWLIIAGVLAVVLVLLGAVTTRHKLRLKDGVLALLALAGFAIWSLAIPDSGWYRIDWISEHPGWVALMAGVGGIIFGAIATVIKPDG